MSDTVIKVENLSKQYRIGAKEGYRTFRETLVDAAKAPFQSVSRLLNRTSHIANRTSQETIWALKNVSFEVKRGEVVGIIGRNGAGKSTLLKILSKITEPTEGRIELRGRVGSLLEVGTGFHPELTGHENIYLYGAILGMDRWEISRKFDEIVAFAELEKFIDTPVKRYSSGMYMRLAFAVAAHLEPEILMIDEVLAVGDMAFQNKCLGKMGDISKEGRTVLIVSHNLNVMVQLSDNCFVLDKGSAVFNGETREAVEIYEKFISANGKETAQDHSQNAKKNYIKAVSIKQNESTLPPYSFTSTEGFEVSISYSLPKYDICMIGIAIVGPDYKRILTCLSHWTVNSRQIPSDGIAKINFPPLNLATGRYHLIVSIKDIADKKILEIRDPALFFEIVSDPKIPLSHMFYGKEGIISIAGEWKFESSCFM